VAIGKFNGARCMENYANHGSVLRKLREKKGLTQRQLSKADDPLSFICSERTLIRIEKGEIALSEKYLSDFLLVLGMSYAEFCNEIDGGPETTLFLNGFSEVWDLLFEKKHSKAKARMESLITETTIDLDKPLIKQAVMLYECRERAECDNISSGCLEELCKAMHLTSPHIVVGRAEIALLQVSSGTFTLNEYRIMNIMAFIKECQGDMDASVEIYRAIKESLESKFLPNEIRNKMLPTICYNLADALTGQGEYEEATNVSEAGLKHGKMTGSHRMDGLLYYSMAKAQHLMGKKDKAVENFSNSYFSHKVQGKNEMAERVKGFAAGKYDVYIE